MSGALEIMWIYLQTVDLENGCRASFLISTRKYRNAYFAISVLLESQDAYAKEDEGKSFHVLPCLSALAILVSDNF